MIKYLVTTYINKPKNPNLSYFSSPVESLVPVGRRKSPTMSLVLKLEQRNYFFLSTHILILVTVQIERRDGDRSKIN
jgi:hypothetical protein